ncbi:hypothetical protein [Nonomuraea endophytica]|uniref:hypothetical protein n=1 Tax=Nonomuraea endophytica TaxID=714136 RepID=UPI0037C74ABB
MIATSIPVAGVAVRLILVVTLLWGGLLSAMSAFPGSAPLSDFHRDLRSGQVDVIVADVSRVENPEVHELIWADSKFSWHRAELWTDESPGPYLQSRLSKDVSDAGFTGLLDVRTRDDGGPGLWPVWLSPVPYSWNWMVVAAYVISLVIMLGSTPRFANRWAWFWLFTFGQTGAILFLLLEPRPIWSALDPEPPPLRTGRMSGGSGCVASIGLGFVSGLLAWWVGLAVSDHL